MPWATIILKEGGSLDVGGRTWESGKPLRTGKQSLIDWAKANSRFRVTEETEVEKTPKKPGPKPKAAVESKPKADAESKPKVKAKAKPKPKAKAKVKKKIPG